MVLSTREKLLIALLAAILVAMALWFGVGGLRSRLADLEARVLVQESLARKAAALKLEEARLRQPASRNKPTTRTRSLIGYVEQLADRVGVRDRIQLNLLPQDASKGLQGLDIRVNGLSLDEAVGLMYTLEDADLRLVVDQLELSHSFREKNLLRLSMRVLARE